MSSDTSSSAKSNCTNSFCSTTSMQMRTIINEFKHVYQQKLKSLDEEENAICQQESIVNDKLKLKVKTLESYVKDLLEQNDVLVQTIDELEKEANSRMAKLEAKLQKLNSHSKVQFFYCLTLFEK
jgi:soluble cytochrome b562